MPFVMLFFSPNISEKSTSYEKKNDIGNWLFLPQHLFFPF
jgi:hypothetical protein